MVSFSSIPTKLFSRCATTMSVASRRSFQTSTICCAKLNVTGLADKVDLDGKNVLVRVDLNVPLAKVRLLSCKTIGRL